jgi:hypothetical protein
VKTAEKEKLFVPPAPIPTPKTTVTKKSTRKTPQEKATKNATQEPSVVVLPPPSPPPPPPPVSQLPPLPKSTGPPLFAPEVDVAQDSKVKSYVIPRIKNLHGTSTKLQLFLFPGFNFLKCQKSLPFA